MKKLVFGALLLLNLSLHAQAAPANFIPEPAADHTILSQQLSPEEFSDQLIQRMNAFTISSYKLPLSQQLISFCFYGFGAFLTAVALKAILTRYATYKPTFHVLIPTGAAMVAKLAIPDSVRYVAGVARVLDKPLLATVLKNDAAALAAYLTNAHIGKNPALPKYMPLMMQNAYLNCAINMLKSLKPDAQDTARNILINQLEYAAQHTQRALLYLL